MIPLIAIYVIGIPCAIVVATLLPFWLPDRKTINAEELSVRMMFGAALGCALAYMAGHWGQGSFPKLPQVPPTDAADWLFFIAPFCAFVAFVEGGLARIPKQASTFHFSLLVLRAIVVGGSVWLVLTPERRNHPDNVWKWVPALSVLLLLQWESWAALARRNKSFDISASLYAVIGGSCAVLALSGGARYGLLCGTLAAISGAIFFGSLIFSNFPLARGLANVAAPLGFLLVVLGYFLADVPLKSGVLLAAAPFAAWIAELPPVKRLKPWQIAMLRVTCVAVMVGIAVAIAAANQPTDDGYGG